MNTIDPYHLDPDCPEAIKIVNALHAGLGDPMTVAYGAGDAIALSASSQARAHILDGCYACEESLAANV